MAAVNENKQTPAAKPGRDSNIELLRVIMSVGVIFLHLNYSEGGGLLSMTEIVSVKGCFSCTLETLFICAVNVFLIISGYFMAETRKLRIVKVIKLPLIVSFFSLIAYFAQTALGISTFSAGELLKSAIPHNYYITFYICILLFSVYISKLCSVLDAKQFRLFVYLVTGVVIVYPFIVSCLEAVLGMPITGLSSISVGGDGQGYTLLNFLAVYLLGIAVKKDCIRIKHPAVVLLICSVILYVSKFFLHSAVAGVVYAYNDPFVVLSALSWFLLFRDLRIGCSSVINYLGKISLGVYLIHTYIIRIVGFQWAENIGILGYIGVQAAIVLGCFIASMLCTEAFNLIWRILQKLRIVNKLETIMISV